MPVPRRTPRRLRIAARGLLPAVAAADDAFPASDQQPEQLGIENPFWQFPDPRPLTTYRCVRRADGLGADPRRQLLARHPPHRADDDPLR